MRYINVFTFVFGRWRIKQIWHKFKKKLTTRKILFISLANTNANEF